jgi:hypothetical protein
MDTQPSMRAPVGGRPWPEALAGAVIGAMLVMAGAFVPQLSPYIDGTNPMLGPLLLVGALCGAIVSWFLAKPELQRLSGRRPAIVKQGLRRAA